MKASLRHLDHLFIYLSFAIRVIMYLFKGFIEEHFSGGQVEIRGLNMIKLHAVILFNVNQQQGCYRASFGSKEVPKGFNVLARMGAYYF